MVPPARWAWSAERACVVVGEVVKEVPVHVVELTQHHTGLEVLEIGVEVVDRGWCRAELGLEQRLREVKFSQITTHLPVPSTPPPRAGT